MEAAAGTGCRSETRGLYPQDRRDTNQQINDAYCNRRPQLRQTIGCGCGASPGAHILGNALAKAEIT